MLALDTSAKRLRSVHVKNACRISPRLGGPCDLMVTSLATPTTSLFSVRRVLLAVVALFVLLYLVDFAWFQLRSFIPKLGPTTGSVHRIRLLAISSKGNKIEYEIDAVHPEEDVPCSHSVFPQGGNRPCWYLARHAKDPIPM